MKTLEFETSKGKFKLIDMPDEIRVNNWNGTIVIDEENQIPKEKFAKGFILKNVTEEQANAIVDYPFELEVADYSVLVFKDYEDDENTYTSSIDSLYSLLESKGIHLFGNPVPEPCMNGYIDDSWINDYNEAEQKIFYNPFIYKL